MKNKDIERYYKIKGDLNNIYFTYKIHMKKNKEKITVPKLDIEIKRDLSVDKYLIKNNIRVN
jgi:hypothetical protein